MNKQKIILGTVYCLTGFILAFLIFTMFNKPHSYFKEENYIAKPSNGDYLSYMSASGDEFKILYPLADIIPSINKSKKNLDTQFVTFSLNDRLSNKNINSFAISPKTWDRKDGRIGFIYGQA